jgi:hypothetical protein
MFHVATYLLPEYRSHLGFSLPPENGSKFLACCILSEDQLHFGFWQFANYPPKKNIPTNLNYSTGRNPVDLIQMRIVARLLVHTVCYCLNIVDDDNHMRISNHSAVLESLASKTIHFRTMFL